MPSDPHRGRVSQAQWAAPLDDRPSPRTTAIVGTALGVMSVAAAAFLAWAVSKDRDPALTPLRAAITTDASPAPRTRLPAPREHEAEGAFVLGPDAAPSYAALLGEETPDLIDDTLGSCLPGDGLHDGAAVRLLTTEDPAQAGHRRIVALEYAPPGDRPVRLYGFTGKDARGYFDETGQRGCSTGWRRPLAALRRTSPFNPHRMHPILHRLMPHEGTDFGSPKGTPVYASYRGVVDWAGPHGSHGTWVSLVHPEGTETGYAHLSKIVPGLKHGDHVRAHQLIGYVGSTGRSTGPHLHFSARKDGAFFDAETLLGHAAPGVPEAERAAFLAAKGQADRRLDALAAPVPVAAAPASPPSSMAK